MACCAASGHRKPGRRIALPRDPRVKLSQQRTFLAWVRTAVSLLALGLVLAKFSLFLARLDPALSLAATNRLSLFLVVAGGLTDLLAGLAELCFGPADRPATYRALAQLERDGLVASSSGLPGAGSARRVYRITGDGQLVLRAWMEVVKQEHDRLGEVLRRYHATGTVEAVSPRSSAAGRRPSVAGGRR